MAMDKIRSFFFVFVCCTPYLIYVPIAFNDPAA